MDEFGITEAIIPIIAILSTIALPIITALVLIVRKINAEHTERMGMINQGIIPPDKSTRSKTPNRYVSLRNGIILVSLGVGVLVAIIAIAYNNVESPFLFTIASTMFFLGIGYLIFFFLTRNSKEYNKSYFESDVEDESEQL